MGWIVGFLSPWAYVVEMAALFGLAATPLFKAADKPPKDEPRRLATLDGLRGFLAFAVFFQHGAIIHGYLLTGVWDLPGERLYDNLGRVGVAVFFMITGFLFWGQLLRAKGRPDWLRLYVGRAFRILPLYWVAMALMLLGVGIVTGWHLVETPLTVTKEVARWVLGGGLLSGGDINGLKNTFTLTAGVMWSLKWEWRFYAALLLLALLCRRPLISLIVTSVCLAASVAFLAVHPVSGSIATASVIVPLFLSGMVSAAVADRYPRLSFAGALPSAAVCVLLVTATLAFPTSNAAVPAILLAAAFFLITRGTSVFGLLTSRAAVRLGDISFGIYLLQGLVLSAVFAHGSARTFALAGPVEHWTLVFAGAVLLLGLATLTHAAVERPGIAVGQKAMALVKRAAASVLNSSERDCDEWEACFAQGEDREPSESGGPASNAW